MQSQRTTASKKRQSEMMKDYLARGPTTATEKLVSQSGDLFRTSASTSSADNLRNIEAYLDQLARQAQGSGSHRS